MFTSEQLTRLQETAREQLPALSSKEALARAQKFLENELISSAKFGEQSFDDGALWSRPASRANQRYLHGFLFFIDWKQTILKRGDSRHRASAQAVLRIVTRWVDMHPFCKQSQGMAYHDETTAQRLINIISLYPTIVSILGERDAAPLERLMASTAEILAKDDFHAGNNNHGMFQDLALLYYSLLGSNDPKIRDNYFQLSLRRLREYFSSCFTTEGVHVENTPTYHLMVSRQLANVQRLAQIAAHEDAEYYRQLIQKAETYAAHAVMPDGLYPPISDTQQVATSRSGMGNIFPGSVFEYASTQGRRGMAPNSRFLILPETGYAIYRSSWGDPLAVYAFFSAAYNADYHKHSDDLSFFLRSGGRDILSESGPYGYDYKHPFSKYAYSQYSHNSLIVDEKSLPRTDGQMDRVYMQRETESSTGFTVLGVNSRYADTVHSRRVQVIESDGDVTFRLDDVVSSTQTHSYQLLWNLGLDVRAHLTEDGFDVTNEGATVMQLRIKATVPFKLSLHEGENKPRPLGWRFPRFGEALPTQVVVINFSGVEAELTTDIRLADFEDRPRRIRVSEPATISSASQPYQPTYSFKPGRRGGSLDVSVALPSTEETAFRLYKGSEPVSTTRYSSEHEVSFDNLPPGRYRVRIFVRDGSGARITALTTGWCEV